MAAVIGAKQGVCGCVVEVGFALDSNYDSRVRISKKASRDCIAEFLTNLTLRFPTVGPRRPRRSDITDEQVAEQET